MNGKSKYFLRHLDEAWTHFGFRDSATIVHALRRAESLIACRRLKVCPVRSDDLNTIVSFNPIDAEDAVLATDTKTDNAKLPLREINGLIRKSFAIHPVLIVFTFILVNNKSVPVLFAILKFDLMASAVGIVKSTLSIRHANFKFSLVLGAIFKIFKTTESIVLITFLARICKSCTMFAGIDGVIAFINIFLSTGKI